MNKFLKKHGQFIFGNLFLFYFFFTLFQAVDLGFQVVIALLLTLIIYIKSVWTFFYYYKKKGKPRLQDWMRVTLFIMLVLNFMGIVNESNGETTIYFSAKSFSLLNSFFTMLVIIIALFSLDIAYLINRTKKVTRVNNIHYCIMHKRWVFIILFVSTLTQFYLILSGFSGYGSDFKYTQGILSVVKLSAGILNPFAIIISSYIIFIENNIKYKFIFYTLLSMQIFIGVLSGMKENALLPILYVGIVFLIAGRKIPKKIIYVGLFFAFFLYPLNNAYRNVINNDSMNTGSSALNLVIAVNKVLKEPLLETLNIGTESYAERGSMFSYLQYSIDIEPSWDYYKYMTRYAIAPVSWIIPRIIWKEKPTSDIGNVLSKNIIGEENRSSVTPTSIGWSYLEGGVLFVIPIFILVGLLFEIIDNSDLKNPLILFLYTLLFQKVLKPEWDPYFFLVGMLQTYVMCSLLLKLIGVKKNIHEN